MSVIWVQFWNLIIILCVCVCYILILLFLCDFNNEITMIVISYMQELVNFDNDKLINIYIIMIQSEIYTVNIYM